MQQKEAATVRNPVLGLAEAKDLGEFLADQPELRSRFTALLRELGCQADAQAERSWTQRKATNGRILAGSWGVCPPYYSCDQGNERIIVNLVAQ